MTDAMNARPRPLASVPPETLSLSQTISALSFALDITEGQPIGHAVRSCLIGMRLAAEIEFPAEQRHALYYALLLKDAGCSSNAAKMASLFKADDRWLKHDVKTIDWPNKGQSLIYVACHAAPNGSLLEKAKQILILLRAGDKGARHLVETRCERGANIVRMLDFPEDSSQAILALDEHWDGRGQPLGLKGEEIPLSGRILGLAQTAEVFFCTAGVAGVYEMALRRRGTWFDPDLVDALCSFRDDAAFWNGLAADDVQEHVTRLAPDEQRLRLDDTRLDRVAQAFASIIDAKSPWTYNHSTGVAEIAHGIGTLLGLSASALRDLKRAALLHDVGKLGVSSLILDKPGKLTDDEFAQMRRHSHYTEQILGRVDALRHVSELACSHHERLDGKGYHRGLTAEDLSTTARILPVADIYQALSADRPYRSGMSPEQALGIMRKDVGAALCPRAFAGLEQYLDRFSAQDAAARLRKAS
jgi:HD-GYP domain-containing protein (c-di-GMP phosphodiesterase class II)